MFSTCSKDVCRIFLGCFQDAPMGLMSRVESMDFNDPKELDDPQLFDNPSYWMIPAIWWSIGSMDFDNSKVYGDTSITDGLMFYNYRTLQFVLWELGLWYIWYVLPRVFRDFKFLFLGFCNLCLETLACWALGWCIWFSLSFVLFLWFYILYF